jgi:phosphoglucosamine mutase
MTRQYFGTDGIRGRVGQDPMTVEFAVRLAHAAARALAPHGGTVLIGKDTRVSGYMFESALEAGFVAAGVNVKLVGPLPTPAIAYLTQSLDCDFGIVISASHNPFDDNGIKFFNGQGAKLSDALEREIEKGLSAQPTTVESIRLGRAVRIDHAGLLYEEQCRSTFPAGLTLEGVKLVVDCANGAGYKVAPRVLAALGAEIIPIGCSPNGRNINADCGSTHPALLQLTVKGVHAQVGIALDGDGDRLVMVDHQGQLVDGDQLLYVLACGRQRAGLLHGPVVGTVMSNLGLEHALNAAGIEFVRAAVGDRYVLELLRERGGVVGGESSGHLLCLDQATTGDALVSALQILAIMQSTGQTLAELVAPMVRYPQVLLNVPVARPIALDHEAIQAAVLAANARLAANGRVLLRASGTEPVIRVMVEGREQGLVREVAEELARIVGVVASR